MNRAGRNTNYNNNNNRNRNEPLIELDNTTLDASRLDLTNDRLSKAIGNIALENVRSFYCSYNKLNEIPEEAALCVNMRALFAGTNSIRSFPKTLW
jgi:Leucine-rich repeat (LRR) protein